VKSQLLFFAQELKKAVSDLKAYFLLGENDRLMDVIEVLCKFAAKHQEYIEKLVERKKLKMLDESRRNQKKALLDESVSVFSDSMAKQSKVAKPST
jgi:hypothetical protein